MFKSSVKRTFQTSSFSSGLYLSKKLKPRHIHIVDQIPTLKLRYICSRYPQPPKCQSGLDLPPPSQYDNFWIRPCLRTCKLTTKTISVYIGIFIGRCLEELLRGPFKQVLYVVVYLSKKLKPQHIHRTAGTHLRSDPDT